MVNFTGDLHHTLDFHSGLNIIIMKQRHELLSQSKLYTQQHPCDASLTIEQLQDMMGTLDSIQLMNHLQRYATMVFSSKLYRYTRYISKHKKDQPHSFGLLVVLKTIGQNYIHYCPTIHKQRLPMA